jgi:hypothetical protein
VGRTISEFSACHAPTALGENADLMNFEIAIIVITDRDIRVGRPSFQ